MSAPFLFVSWWKAWKVPSMLSSLIWAVALCCGAVEFGDFVAVGDEDDAGAIDEEAVFDDAGDVAEFA